MRILLTGGSGILGRELVKTFPNSWHPTHHGLDIADEQLVHELLAKYRPEIIIHAAALTSVRECETNRERAYKTNVGGTTNLVNACLSFVPHCYFVYVSTACVFYGDRGNYIETDIPYPKNFYGLTKLLGEFEVKHVKNSLIIRTNFVGRGKWRYSKAFEDRFGTYLFATDVARAIEEVVDANLTGIVHIVGDRILSMFELARLTTPDVGRMALNEYVGPPLTLNMTLDTVRWKRYRIGWAGQDKPDGSPGL